MSYHHPIDASLIHDYIERRLSPEKERSLEEAMLNDPSIAEEVHFEMALTDGMRAAARRAKTQFIAVSPASNHQPNNIRPSTFRRPALAIAAAASIAIIASVAWTQLRSNSFTQQTVAIQSAAQTPLSTAPLVLDPSTRTLKIVSATKSKQIFIELSDEQSQSPHRLILERPDQSGISLALNATTLASSGAIGFALNSEGLSNGQYNAQLEKLEGGNWQVTQEFVVNVE